MAATYSITPNPATVNEAAGTLSFTVTRSGGLPAEAIFASTTQTEGFTNCGDYTGITNQNVVFGLNQTQARVTVSIRQVHLHHPRQRHAADHLRDHAKPGDSIRKPARKKPEM